MGQGRAGAAAAAVALAVVPRDVVGREEPRCCRCVTEAATAAGGSSVPTLTHDGPRRRAAASHARPWLAGPGPPPPSGCAATGTRAGTACATAASACAASAAGGGATSFGCRALRPGRLRRPPQGRTAPRPEAPRNPRGRALRARTPGRAGAPLDAGKPGRIPPGGGKRFAPGFADTGSGPKGKGGGGPGCVHVAIGDRSRCACAGALPDGRGPSAVAFPGRSPASPAPACGPSGCSRTTAGTTSRGLPGGGDARRGAAPDAAVPAADQRQG